VNKADTFILDTPDTAHPRSLSQQIDGGSFPSPNLPLSRHRHKAPVRLPHMAPPPMCRQIWDTTGQERFHAVTSTYYRIAFDMLFIYDISRRSTFDTVGHWL
jgi:hypothetical protein